MTARTADHEVIGTRGAAPITELPLFESYREDDKPNWAGGLNDSAKKHARDIGRLIPLAQNMALRAKEHGVTVGELRKQATGIYLTGHEKDLDWLGAVMKAAGLIATPRMRRSKIGKSKSNPHRVWVHERFRSERDG